MRRACSLVFILLLAVGCESPDANEIRIAPSPEEVRPLLPGMAAPAFELPAGNGSIYRFDPDSLSGPTALVFYRGGWCPYCLRHLSALRSTEEPLEEMGFELLFVSADSPDILAAADTVEGVDYTLLSDDAMTTATDFGLAFYVDEETVTRYQEIGLVDLEAETPGGRAVLPAPAVYLIDEAGIIQFMYVNPDYRVRLEPEVLLAAARAMVPAS